MKTTGQSSSSGPAGHRWPAIFNVHNSYHENLISYLAPYDIPLEDLEADFVGVSAHEIDGNVYYTDYGMMTATMYYNKSMWDAAGLTEADIPKTVGPVPRSGQKADHPR